MKRTLTLKADHLAELTTDELATITGGTKTVVDKVTTQLHTWPDCMTGNYSIVC